MQQPEAVKVVEMGGWPVGKSLHGIAHFKPLAGTSHDREIGTRVCVFFDNGGKAMTTPKANNQEPRSLAIAAKGIKTGNDFANLMSALMSDLIDGRVTPSIGNATCNAGGKLLKIVEMSYRHGTQGPGTGTKTLILALEDGAPPLVASADRKRREVATV